jgi:hypothetical protein
VSNNVLTPLPCSATKVLGGTVNGTMWCTPTCTFAADCPNPGNAAMMPQCQSNKCAYFCNMNASPTGCPDGDVDNICAQFVCIAR